MSELRQIPGFGGEAELDLQALGIQRIDQLDGADPQALFVRLAAHQGGYTDRCNLYVYRCAVYYAEGGRDADLLKWWNWKDSAEPPLRRLKAYGI
ncbi:MAG: Pathogenicity locus [Gemmatimonadetes bacterium]|nr:Pathogenicity locus [Gemmatimonadota bacterium]